MFHTNVTDGTFFDATILPELPWIGFVQVSNKQRDFKKKKMLINLFIVVSVCLYFFFFEKIIFPYISIEIQSIYRDTSSPITPLKSLDSPLLYGYKSANNSESCSSNSSGNSPNNTSNTENLNLIDLIVSSYGKNSVRTPTKGQLNLFSVFT